MDCIACQQRSGYNRAVVDTTTGRELGPLCVRCETEYFGELAAHPGSQRTDDGCLYCDRDGVWALPKWLPEAHVEGGRVVSRVDYDAERATLRLCDEHLAALDVDTLAPTRTRSSTVATGDPE
ncbi:hypothetical protein [Halobacterium sp. CBA1126]|uniref:hypothetical protein n=1 Tax=Halobacterium TaxID=2239 RepID=UPI0012FBC734|nr:hypothetical protein [Halobacterium sp. CBA1126]MUV61902.1 hypothetical protein [Halobacterium sp. CBA1126]